MKQNIWMFNHYATNMFFDRAGRHYWFAENLIKKGYKPTIFCASTNHFYKNHIDTKGRKYYIDSVDSIPFVFINTPKYNGNRIRRIVNMFSFYTGLFVTTKTYAKLNGTPDVILASSVHPLTLVAGIKIAKKFGIPCICEVRDLWPQSLIAYGIINSNSVIAKLLYQLEKWTYKKADAIIMTWEGGKQYIIDQGWDKQINLKKVKHISNGIVIDSFDKNSIEHKISDIDLDNKNYKNMVYAGSIRKVNNLGLLLEAAKLVQEIDQSIKFLIYGDGDEKNILENRCIDECINNIIFKGRVEKKVMPSILKRSHANILHNSSTALDKYGQSQNKLFEYLAAGRCVIQTYTTSYSVLKKYNCGISAIKQSPEDIAKIIVEVCKNENKSQEMGQNARRAAFNFDFTKLTDELVEVIESI